MGNYKNYETNEKVDYDTQQSIKISAASVSLPKRQVFESNIWFVTNAKSIACLAVIIIAFIIMLKFYQK